MIQTVLYITLELGKYGEGSALVHTFCFIVADCHTGPVALSPHLAGHAAFSPARHNGQRNLRSAQDHNLSTGPASGSSGMKTEARGLSLICFGM